VSDKNNFKSKIEVVLEPEMQLKQLLCTIVCSMA